MTTLNFKQPRERNNYLLEIEEISVAKSIRKPRVKGGFSAWKKFAAGAVAATIMGLALVSGALVTTSTTSQSAQAAGGGSISNIPGFFCITKDDDIAYLGGSNNVVKSSWVGSQSSSTGGLEVSVPMVLDKDGKATDEKDTTQRWTALEQYGYASPTYNSWQGMFVEAEDKDTAPYIGTGGGGTTSSYGTHVVIENAQKSPFFSHSIADCTGFGPAMNVSLANAIGAVPKFFVAFAGEVYGWSSTVTLTDENSPLSAIATGVEKIIVGDSTTPGLKNILFLDFLTPLVIIAAIGLAYTGLVKKSSMQAGQGAIWMIAAAVGAVLLLSNPLLIPRTIDNVVGQVNQAISSALVSGGTEQDFCALTDGTKDQAVRQIKCVVWYTSIYTPWVSGQFGVDQYKINDNKVMTNDPNIADGKSAIGDGENLGEGFKEKTPTDANIGDSRGVFSRSDISFGSEVYAGKMNWALYQMDRQHNTYGANKGVDYSEIAYNQLVINDNTRWSNANSSISAAVISLIAAVGPSLVLFTIGFTLLGYQVTMLMLIAFSPLFFLMGVAPGWGRRTAMRWLELIVGLLVKRIVLMLFLLVFIKMYTLIIGTIDIFIFQLIMVAVLSTVAMTQREKIMGMFTNAINFGGGGGLDDGGDVGRKMKQDAQRGLSGGNRAAGRVLRAAPVIGRATQRRVIAPTARAGANKFNASRTNAQDKKMTKKGDEKLGIGSNRDIEALDNIRPDNIDKLDDSRLTPREHSRIEGSDGKVDSEKALAFIEERKTIHTAESNSINAQHEELNRTSDRIKNMSKSPAMKAQRIAAKKQYTEDRNQLRIRQARLNSEVQRVFGKATKKLNDDPQYNRRGKSKKNLSTSYKSKAKPVR